MRIQTHNERSNAIGLDWDLEADEVESKERNGRNDKKELKTMFFHLTWTCKKFAQSCEMEQKGFWLQLKGEKRKLILAWPCKMLQEGKNGVDEFSTSHNHAKLLELVQNCIFFQISWRKSL